MHDAPGHESYTIRAGCTLRKLYFHFLSHSIEYDRGDSSPFNFEPNRIPFGSKSKGKLSPRPYPIQCERKWNTSFLSGRSLIFSVNSSALPGYIESDKVFIMTMSQSNYSPK